MKPKVSVIVPVYNVEPYLEKCLTSLVHQTLKEIEIIIVNDGTKDNSQLIIDQFVKDYPTKVKSFIKENGGLGDARNFGIPIASADYIGFIDSDDYIELTMYEKMYKLSQSEFSDIVLCDIQYEWEGTSKTHILNGLRRIIGIDQNKSIFLSPLFAWNKLYRKSLFLELNLMYPKNLWYEDLPVTLPFFANTKKISYIHEPLVHYVQRNTSIMNTKSNKKMFDIFTILTLVMDYFKQNNLDDKFNNELEYIFIEQVYLYGSFRFLRSDIYKELFSKANIMSESNFKNWKKNPYLKYLPLKYRIYLRTLYSWTIPLYQVIVRNK